MCLAQTPYHIVAGYELFDAPCRALSYLGILPPVASLDYRIFKHESSTLLGIFSSPSSYLSQLLGQPLISSLIRDLFVSRNLLLGNFFHVKLFHIKNIVVYGVH